MRNKKPGLASDLLTEEQKFAIRSAGGKASRSGGRPKGSKNKPKPNKSKAD